MQGISRMQMRLIGAMFVLDASLITVPAQGVQYAKQHAYLSLLLAFIVIMLPLWLLSKVLWRYKHQDLYGALLERFPIGGKVIISSYVLFFFLILVRDIRTLSDFTNVTLLFQTPIYVIGILIVITAIITARGGVENLGRLTELHAPVLLLAILLIPSLLFREFDLTMLMPFGDFKVAGILQGSWVFFPYIGEAIGMVMLGTIQTFKLRDGFVGLAIGTFFLFLLVLSAQFALGGPVMSRSLYPTYELVRELRATDFLDRFDLPLVGIWMPTMLVKIGYSLYIVCHGLKKIFPEASTKLLVSPFGILAYVCAFWFFSDTVHLLNFNRTWPCIALIFELLLPILLFFLLRPKRRNGRAKEAEAGG